MGLKCSNHLPIFHDFQGLENLNFKLHNFPGPVYTLCKHSRRNQLCKISLKESKIPNVKTNHKY